MEIILKRLVLVTWQYDECHCDMVRYNVVNLEDGSLDFVEDDTIVTIANVHIEKD